LLSSRIKSGVYKKVHDFPDDEQDITRENDTYPTQSLPIQRLKLRAKQRDINPDRYYNIEVIK
jgi:hypothetical protein